MSGETPAVREVTLRSARGERLEAVLHDPATAVRGLVIVSPCFTCTRDIAPVRNLARDLAAAGFRACRYDPIGSGTSEGLFEDATLSKYRDDLVAVATALLGAEPLHLAGHSLGGAASLLAARALEGTGAAPRSVVTLGTNARKDSLRRLLGAETFERAKREGSIPFDSGDRVLRPLTRSFVEDLEGHDVLAAAEGLACPLLVIHGEADSIVPLDAARELATRARADLVAIPGGEHLLSRREDRERIRAATLAFLGRDG